MASPFLSKEFKETITTLRENTIDTLKEKFEFYSSDWHRMSESAREYAENDIQMDVIASLKKKYTPEIIEGIVYQAQQWVTSKEGIIRQCLRSTEKETEERLTAQEKKFVKQRYVKVVVKCNSQGGDEVRPDDLNPWLDSLTEQVLSVKHKKFLTKSRNQVKNNLARMLAFPVSVKETLVESYVSEEDFLKDIERERIYVPESARNISDLFSIILVTLNGVRYLTPKGKLIEETEGRLKTNEPDKMGKYTVGVRSFPHYDGVAFKKIVPNVVDIPDACKSVINIGLKGEEPNISYRFNGSKLEIKYGKHFPYTGDFLKEARQNAEDRLIFDLKNPYVDVNGNITRSIKEDLDVLVTGVWIDMVEKVSKAPTELQIKNLFADEIYKHNSLIGHNSKDYDFRRNEKCKTKISVFNPISGKKEQITLSTQLILDYHVNDILRPAFSSVQF
jgi:hypothetical protein